SVSAFSTEQATQCGKSSADSAGSGVPYSSKTAPALTSRAGDRVSQLDAYPWTDKAARAKALQAMSADAGYDFTKVRPGPVQIAGIIASLSSSMASSGFTYGPVAASSTEMFPPRIRYSSMSIPYHIGTGYFGGFSPFISSSIVAKTGDPYSGSWYTWVVVAVAFLVAMWGLKGGPPQAYGDDAAVAGAAVKADASGMGATVVVPESARAGRRNCFVTHWSEAAASLPHVPAEQIAVSHGPSNDADVAFALESGVRPVLNSSEQARRWSAAGGGACHVMVDTGINRSGSAMGDSGDPVSQASTIDCCISHSASADEDVPQNAQQWNRFEQVRRQVSARRYSSANSAGIMLGTAYHADSTRPGSALYGGIARAEMAGAIRQVAYPEAAVSQVRRIEAGEGVGYNATFIAPRPMRAGVIASGYADGYSR
ncbi:hypothetical protein OY671_007672, partial [Metschnikowia pulcherrima]